jgi:hypothetical protein
MVSQRFSDFWESEKSITEDIFFRPSAGHNEVYIFDEIGFVGESCEGMYVTGDYNCRTGSLAVNFQLRGVGAVHRYCLGGPIHKDSGRYHEHLIQNEKDVGSANLPYAVPRTDLVNLSPKVAWLTICKEAKIAHTGKFSDPEEWCK